MSWVTWFLSSELGVHRRRARQVVSLLTFDTLQRYGYRTFRNVSAVVSSSVANLQRTFIIDSTSSPCTVGTLLALCCTSLASFEILNSSKGFRFALESLVKTLPLSKPNYPTTHDTKSFEYS